MQATQWAESFRGQRQERHASSNGFFIDVDLLQVASLMAMEQNSLLATISPEYAGRLTVSAAYLPVIGEPITFARIPLLVKPAGIFCCSYSLAC